MTINPYASPMEADDPARRADREIRSVIRTFRLLSIFAISEAVVFLASLLHSLLVVGADLFATAIVATMQLFTVVCSIFYLRAANRMAGRIDNARTTAGRLSLMMILGFPLFPMGLACVPAFAVAGWLCYRKVARYYIEYCQNTA